jgi:hypothetical protein
VTAHELTNIKGAAVSPDSIEAFKTEFRGEVIRPKDAA